jgi:hypothetical protein
MSTYANDVPRSAARPRIVSAARVRHAARWFAWSLPALPVAVLVHEMGHLAWFKIFHFPDVRLHYGAVSYGLHDRFWTLARHGDLAGAARVVPLAQIGLATATGIVISYVTLAGAAYLTAKRPPHPFIVAVGLTAALRFKIGIQVLQRLLFTSDHIPSGTDEGLVSAVSGIPEALLWIVGLAIAIGSWYVIIRHLPRGERLRDLLCVAAGVIAGGALYVMWLGPRLLPY